MIEGSEYPNDIVVLGGKSSIDNEILFTTEIYKSDLGKWEIGPDYPSPIYGSILVNYDSDTILSIGGSTVEGGGYVRQIKALAKTKLNMWDYFGDTRLARSAHVAFIVPQETVLCEGDVGHFYDEFLPDEELIEEMDLQ